MRDGTPGSLQWAILVALSAPFVVGMLSAGLPGAWMLGPMLAGIVVGVNGGSIRVAAPFRVGTQAIIGCMVACLITRPVLASFARQWPIFLIVTLSTLLASSVLGGLLSRRRVLPGTTAVWGVLPGAASAMVLMAESHGGDPRLVALMQYLRIIPRHEPGRARLGPDHRGLDELDMPLVMGLQTIRAIAVLSLGPSLARLNARLARRESPVRDHAGSPRVGASGSDR